MCINMLQLFLVATLVTLASADNYFSLNNPNDGDVLSLGTPYAVTWNIGSKTRGSTCVLVLERCPTSYSRTLYCSEVVRFSNLTLSSGSFSFNGTSVLNDGAFYRFQLLNTYTMDVATSGTFTFAPLPVQVDTTCVCIVVVPCCYLL